MTDGKYISANLCITTGTKLLGGGSTMLSFDFIWFQYLFGAQAGVLERLWKSP